MGTLPLVSVIIPTFNRPAYLPGAIRSALSQTYANMEIIVSDNGPSAEVARLVASFADNRIRYRHNGANVGALRNALAAYREARGAYIGTLHDDDEWEPDFLAKLVPPLEANLDLTVAFSDHWVMDESGALDSAASEATTRRWGRAHLRAGVHRPFHRLALVDRAIPLGSSLLRASVVPWNECPDEVGATYDFWISYMTCRDGRGAYYTPERLTRYRVHQGGLSSQDAFLRAMLFCYDTFLADPQLHSIRARLRRNRAQVQTGIGIAMLAGGQRREAVGQLAAGILRRPETRGLVALALSFTPGNTKVFVDWARKLHGWRRHAVHGS